MAPGRKKLKTTVYRSSTLLASFVSLCQKAFGAGAVQ